jgi:hypothetical protein
MTQGKQQDPRTPLWFDQENFSDFKKAFNKERANPLLFIGSGLSISAGFPNWAQLLRTMKKAAVADYVKVGEDFEAKLKAKAFDQAGSLLKKGFTARHPHANHWRKLLDKIFADPQRVRASSHVVETLCKLPWARIVTTNYDQLIERAYREINDGEELPVYHPWKEHLDAAMSDQSRYLFKIHGDIGDENSKIVLTTEDYRELYDREKHQTFRKVLKSILGSASVILFLGFSYEDQYFRKLFNSLYVDTKAPQRSFGLFPEPPPDIKDTEDRKIRELVKMTGIRPISYRNPDDNHQEFINFLEYLNAPEKYDPIYNAPRLKKKATVILLHTGGTIRLDSRSAREGKRT